MTNKSSTPSQNPSRNPEKKEQKDSSLFLPQQKQDQKGNDVLPPLARIDEKIQSLKKKKERIQTQQALLFMKEAQKILHEDFSPDMALALLSETWKETNENQKSEMRKVMVFESVFIFPLSYHTKIIQHWQIIWETW